MPESQQVGVRELRENLGSILRAAREGKSYVILSRGEPIAELHGIGAIPAVPRQPGALAGRIWMAEDFDRLPDEVIDAMEGDAG